MLANVQKSKLPNCPKANQKPELDQIEFCHESSMAWPTVESWRGYGNDAPVETGLAIETGHPCWPNWKHLPMLTSQKKKKKTVSLSFEPLKTVCFKELKVT